MMWVPFTLVDVDNHVASKFLDSNRDEAATCTVIPLMNTKACLHL
jgi:hypothetical protein